MVWFLLTSVVVSPGVGDGLVSPGVDDGPSLVDGDLYSYHLKLS